MSVTTTDWNHPGINKRRLDGKNEAYIVLTPEERAKGFVRPLRFDYVHYLCMSTTHIGRAMAESFAAAPKFYSSAFCYRCGEHFHVDEFFWEGTEDKVGT